MKQTKNIFFIIAFIFVNVNYSFGQEGTFTKIIIDDPDKGYNTDPTYIFRDDQTNDRTFLKINLGDEYTSDFSIGYNSYVDSEWKSLFSLDGYGKALFKQNLTIGSTSYGNHVLNLNAKESSSELFLLAKVDGVKDYFQLANATAESGQFMPILKGYVESTERTSLYVSGQTSPEQDKGTQPLVIFDGRIIGGPIVNRPLFAWKSYSKTYMKMLADGSLGIGTETPAYKLHVSGDSYFSGGSKSKYTTIGMTKGSSDNGYVREAWVYQYGGQFEWVQDEKLWKRNDYTYNETGGIIYTHSGVSFFQIPRASLIGNKNSFTNSELSDYTYLYSNLSNGNVGIGTKNTAGFKLSVNGNIRATEVKVYTGWADYVFEENYDLKPLSEVEAHIKEHKHLPDVPSAKEVEENGVNVGETEAMLLRKIEELTLYTIEQDKKIKELEAKNKEIEEIKTLYLNQQKLIEQLLKK
ncbi:hypothetical protein [Flammeovirga sp. SJP92]|uniref:hypothetical protein n=1 Tax=Flammeovirga sp. SJP92 TaxID=1775430 RepID=UPI00078724F9|nr:hypothetical protein [Flammeovirga sp. SJP92]KXX71225.1 hypothetical protein AVL50_09215 [Flammeovirga sp. SJP92]